jgi:hypothetical protein
MSAIKDKISILDIEVYDETIIHYFPHHSRDRTIRLRYTSDSASACTRTDRAIHGEFA